jgi:Domain of unknown function (DUF4129)
VNGRALEASSRLNATVMMLVCALGVTWAWTPWTGVIGALAAAFVPWLARRFAGSRPYAPWASVYAALSVFAVPPYTLESIVTERFAAFFSTLVLAYLIGLALDGVQERSAWAWLAPLLNVVAFPTPLGLAGGLGLAILSRVGTNLPFSLHQPRASLGGAVALVGLAVLLSVALPKPGAWLDTWSATPVSSNASTDARDSTRLEDASRADVQNRRRSPPRDNVAQDDWLYVGVNLLLLVGVAGIVVFLLSSRAQRGQGFERRQLWDLLPVVAVLILIVVLIVWSGLAPTASDDSSQGFSSSTLNEIRRLENNAERVPPTEPAPSDSRRASSVTPWVVLLGFAALAYLLWRIRPRSLEATSPPPPDPIANATSAERATDEVRRCYQRFLELARNAGIPRGDTETPLEFAVRIAETAPQARDAAQHLTRLYEPVRYGTLAATRHALEAQSALATLEQTLRIISNPTAPNQKLGARS